MLIVNQIINIIILFFKKGVNKMKKSLLWLVVVMLSVSMIAVFSLVGCKKAEEAAATAEEEVTKEEAPAEEEEEEEEEVAEEEEAPAEEIVLEFWSWNNEGAYPVIHEDAANRFMAENPNVKIERKYISYSDYKPALKSAIAGGEAPDVIQIWPEGIVELAKSGAIILLDDYFKEGFPEFYEPTMAAIRVEGKNYIAPFNVISDQIAYNIEMFEEYGLAIPKTTEELINVAEVLADNGKFAIAVGTKDMWVGKYLWFAQNIYTDPTHSIIGKADKGEISWIQPELIESAQRVIDLLDAGVFAPGANSMDAFVGAKDLFIQQQAAMYFPMGSFNSVGFSESIAGDFTFSMFPFPPKTQDEELPTAVGVLGANFGVSSDCDNVDMGVEFLRHLYDDNAAKIMYESQFIPGFPYEYTGDEEIDPVFQNLIDAQETAVMELIQDPEYSSAMLNGMQGIIGGDMTAEEFVNSLDEAKAAE